MNVAVIEEARLVRHENGTWLFDFGRDAFAQPVFEIDSYAGCYATISVGESLRDGWVDNAPGGYVTSLAKAFPIKIGEQQFDYIFDKHIPPVIPNTAKPLSDGEIMPFRYVQVFGYYLKEVKCTRRAYYGGFNDDAAHFECDNPALNKVWEFCKYSIKATNCFEFYVDGNRERLPYEADSYINQLGDFCCNDQYDKAKNTIYRLLECRTWPIEWLLIMPVVARDYVLYSGDTTPLADWKDGLYERLLHSELREDGLLPSQLGMTVNNENVRAIIDWPVPARDNTVFADKMVVPNCYRYAALNAFAELYNDEQCRNEAKQLKDIIQKQFLMENGLYRDSLGTDHGAIHSQFFAVASGVAEKEQMSAFSALAKERGMACSVYGAQFMLDALYRANEPDLALYMMARPDYPGWLDMLAQGTTVSMEAWSNADKPNQDWNHPWGAAPANVIPRRFCGIRPIEPGFRKFVVMPQPGAGVKQFIMRQPTPHGPITVEYDNGKISVKAPKNTQKI